MLFATQSRKVKQSLVVCVSAAFMALAAPAASQAGVTHHHHIGPAAGHTDPYTRSIIATAVGLK
jgi:hypothetical protein